MLVNCGIYSINPGEYHFQQKRAEKNTENIRFHKEIMTNPASQAPSTSLVAYNPPMFWIKPVKMVVSDQT
jgi:hypothetical protein